jgi:peptidoglycan/LPS O-acetylase OafA/YrhL
LDARLSLESKGVPALDGLRGALALVVLAKHATEQAGLHLHLLHVASQLAVLLFFVLSGFVLARNWKGGVATFLLRRFVRLWPVYAVTLAIGYVITAQTPEVGSFFWLPVYLLDSHPPVNLPAWSLRIEAWAMLGFPIFVWVANGSMRRMAMGFAAVAIASHIQALFAFAFFFLAGACLSRWSFRNGFLESVVPQWLGKVSYSLYLTHWLVLVAAHRYFGANGALAAVPLTFAIGWLVWRGIEVPSIRASRLVRFTPPWTRWPPDRQARTNANTPVALRDP